MKYDHRHFKFEEVAKGFKPYAWKIYYQLKSKPPKELSEAEKYWMRDFRHKTKFNYWTLTGTHVPSKTTMVWRIKEKGRFIKSLYIQKLLAEVKAKRKRQATRQELMRYFDGAAYLTTGGVFNTPNTINNLSEFLNTNDPLSSKSPRYTYKNYIGIELEFNEMIGGPGQNKIAQTLKDAGLAKYVDVTTDGSCGWEVRVLLLEEGFETTLKSILSVISKMGFTCDNRCGTHIHLDMRNRNVESVYKNMFQTQKFLRKFIAHKRKKNHQYCKVNRADTFDKQLITRDRRHAINVEAYKAHRTLEIRMHHGTLDPNELIPWIKLLLKVANYKEIVKSSVTTLKQAKKQFDIDEDLRHNLENRIVGIFKRKKTAARDVPLNQQVAQGQMVTAGTLRNWLGL